MQTDSELLELAAKAAGQTPATFQGIPCGYVRHDGSIGSWNPLTDGDALRLAVKLCMFDGSLFDLFKHIRLEETRLDPSRSDEEITRRTVVRAAVQMQLSKEGK